mmetsp:Transcript_37386/g.99059  ORF Transcript_37386/g.99059 Transcript_37386/m.99059 type:complete len:338 (-) Transcript_37386:16-1029(-)
MVASSLTLSSTTGPSPALVELSHSAFPSRLARAAARARLRLEVALTASLPAMLEPSIPSSRLRGLPGSVLCSSSCATLKSRTSDSLKASCSFFSFPVRSLSASRPWRNSRSPTNFSKSRPSAKLMRSSAASSSNSSFSVSVIAHSGLTAGFLVLSRCSRFNLSTALCSSSINLLRAASISFTALRCFSMPAFIFCLRTSLSLSSISNCSRSSRISLWSSFSHSTCRRNAADGPRFFTAGSKFRHGARPSCSRSVCEHVVLKGMVPSAPLAAGLLAESEGRLHSMTPLKFPRPLTGGAASAAPPPSAMEVAFAAARPAVWRLPAGPQRGGGSLGELLA